MFHTSLYAVTPGGAVAGLDMPAVPDPSVSIVNGHPIFPINVKLILAYLLGNAQTRYAQLVTPKLQAIAIPTVRPIDTNTVPQTRTPTDAYYQFPLDLNAVDENALQLTAAAGAQVVNYGALWFSDGNMNAPQNNVMTVHGTAAPSGAAGSWVPTTFTLDRPLPAGNYAVTGFDAWGANLLFARLIFPSQVWRPGIIPGTSAGFIANPCFRSGKLGTYGVFSSYAQPSIDLFSSGALSTLDVFLDVVKVS